MSAVTACGYVRRMVEREARGSGDTEGALRRIEIKFGLPYWPLVHLRRGVAKTIDADLFARIHAAYLHHCEQQISALRHEIAVESIIEATDDLHDLEDEAAALAAKIAARKAAREMKGRR